MQLSLTHDKEIVLHNSINLNQIYSGQYSGVDGDLKWSFMHWKSSRCDITMVNNLYNLIQPYVPYPIVSRSDREYAARREEPSRLIISGTVLTCDFGSNPLDKKAFHEVIW